MNPSFTFMSYLGVGHGEHRRAGAQASCDSTGSSDTDHHRAKPLFITGDKSRDAALGNPRIRAGEIIGWRIWGLSNGLLHSIFVFQIWRPGLFERATCKDSGPENLGFHAFKDRERAEREASRHIYDSIAIVGSVEMWGEVIEHQYGWRSEYAAVRSITKITGELDFSCRQQLLLDLREKYGCTVVTEL